MKRMHSSSSAERGITLVVSLIMLIVLTLLVVSAIRFGNINLRIAGNAQVEVEASSAANVALEQQVALVNAATRPNDVVQQAFNVSTGGATYAVAVAKPACIFSRNVFTTELDETKAADKPCFEGNDPNQVIFDENGKPIPQPSACKDQQWDVQASIADNNTGAKVTMLQGLSMRVSAEVACP